MVNKSSKIVPHLGFADFIDMRFKITDTRWFVDGKPETPR